jgi:SAM-dependent methyltransferase
MNKEILKQEIQKQSRNAISLFIAYIGVANGLFDCIASGSSSTEDLTLTAKVDRGYLERWLDAAYACGFLDENIGKYSLTETGSIFLTGSDESMMGSAVQAVLGAHMAERIAGLMKTGNIPGEKILIERDTIAPLFGIMLEKNFAPFFENTILPSLEIFENINKRKGTVLDLGCGNGWYLRKILNHYPSIRGIGIDGFSENIKQAQIQSKKENISDRISFIEGDIFSYEPEHPVSALAMNRALHHVWDRRELVFQNISRFLETGGHAVIWEPRWPDDRKDLRDISRQGLAFQNLAEHAQGNFFLTPSQIENEFRKAGMQVKSRLFANGNEAVIIGEK